mgnify:CR=1 FL=1
MNKYKIIDCGFFKNKNGDLQFFVKFKNIEDENDIITWYSFLKSEQSIKYTLDNISKILTTEITDYSKLANGIKSEVVDTNSLFKITFDENGRVKFFDKIEDTSTNRLSENEVKDLLDKIFNVF